MTRRLIFISLTLILFFLSLFHGSKEVKKELITSQAFKIKIWREPPLFKEDFVNQESHGRISHVSSIVPLDQRRLLAVWYSGSKEGAKDVAIFMAIYDEAKGQWSAPEKLVDRDSASQELKRYVKKVGNPMLMRDDSGKIWLFYSSIIAGGWSGSSINYKTTIDGINWTESRKLLLSPFFNLTYNVKNDGLILNDGSFIIPAYSELFKKTSSLIWISEKEGIIRLQKIPSGTGIIQPVLIPDGKDRLLIFFRNSEKKEKRFIPLVEFELKSNTFSELRYTGLPNPDSGFDMIRTEDGSILAVINNSFYNRENLSLFLSRDNGKTWSHLHVLEESPGKEYSYPSITKSLNGFYHITYTYERKRIKHIMFNERWLKEKAEPEGLIQGHPAVLSNTGNIYLHEFKDKQMVKVSFPQSSGGRNFSKKGAWEILNIVGSVLLIHLFIERLIKIFSCIKVLLWIKNISPLFIFFSSLILAFIPVAGLSIKDYILSLNPVFSISSTIFIFHLIFSKDLLFSKKDMFLFSLWIFSVSFCLFLSIYGFIKIDLYSYGYNLSIFFVILFLINMAFAVSGSPLSLVINLYIVAFVFRILPSGNIFDAITDGAALFFSAAILCWLLICPFYKKVPKNRA